MADGQVGFKEQRKVIKLRNIEKKREIFKLLEKTKSESHPDLAKERQERDREVIKIRKEKLRIQAKKDKKDKYLREQEADKRDYDKHLMKEEFMVSNEEMTSSKDTTAAVDFEEDFM